jgi:processive 1,2-diacylglycerol beta-glucosyltransferase
MNEALRRKISRLPVALEGRVQAIGFTHDVDALLEACDAVISKAGGLTCSEALVKRTPLVVFKPTPGQEVSNAKYLVSGGAAVHADSVGEVCDTISRWLEDPRERERVREAAGRLAHPDAAERIARRVLEDLSTHARTVA